MRFPWVPLLTLDSKLLLYCNPSSVGVSIPYPSISLHAIQSLPDPTPGEQQGLYMQLISFAPEFEEDAEPDSVSVTLIPTASAPPTTETVAEGPEPTSEDPVATEGEPEQSPVVALFTALSDCSNLHPDPDEEGNEEDGNLSRLMQAGLIMPGDSQGGLPPAMPGSGGWITAENMHEFFDADGNYIGPEDEVDEEAGTDELGPGAGTVRTRGEDMDTAKTDDTKWQRTG
jgi:nucleotide-sensitive chloride channel 1A